MRSGFYIAALSLLSITVAALSIGSVRLDSATSDEPAYIAAGMIKLTAGRLDFFRDQPPLMNSISAAPLVAAGYEMPPSGRSAETTGVSASDFSSAPDTTATES
ncbi:MAG TPA: hypothetical protein VMS98_19885 [Thermoanaerobaculia bacterium]|nr:hypothetical protein [Thermoanaerobaculia bacterium]